MAVVAVAVALFGAAGVWARATYGARTTADEPQYLLTAISLAEDHNLDIRDERVEQRFRDFHAVDLPVQEAARDDGTLVSPHDPLLPVLLAVPVALGGWLGAKLFLAALAGVLAASMLWVAVRRFGVSLGVAALTILAFGCAAPLSVYATQIYPELPAALAVTVAIGALAGPYRRASNVVLVGALGALPWLSVKYVPVVAVLGVLALVRARRSGSSRQAAAVAGALALAAVVYLVLHHQWYGGWTPYASGSHFAGGEATVMGDDPDYLGRTVRLLGLLVDRDFGLAAWQPAYLLAVPAFAALVARRPRGWETLALPFAAGWLNAMFVALTMHGWWWPGRQVVVVLPCVVLAVAWWAERYRPARVLVTGGAVVGALFIGWVVIDVLAGHMTLIVDFGRTTNPLSHAWRALLPDGLVQPPGTAVLRLAWLLVVAALAVWGVRSMGEADANDGVSVSARPT